MSVKYKYKANTYSEPTIEKIGIERETAHSVFLVPNRRREARICGYHAYFDTFEEAKEHLVKHWKSKVDTAKVNLWNAEGRFGNAKGLKEL